MEPVGDTVPIAELLDERRHLVEVARWMLGSRVAAERVTDEAYRQWYRLAERQRARIPAPRAWLTRVVGGLALARLAPPGTGRPEPPEPAPPREQPYAGLRDAADRALLRALETLSPAERAAFVLNDVFGAPAAGGRAARPDPVERARHSLRARTARPAPPRRQHELAHALRQACADEDAGRLAALLADDVTAFFDGGGKVRALTGPVTGRERVARSLLTLLAGQPRTTLRACPVNGGTGLVARYDETVAAVVTLDVAGSRVVQVWVVLNPDKLRSWNRP
ncbi:sigma factor [Streptomyces sp. NPDC090994]|uniref:sigma factor n=1 Tax=Streptomyces sp. NPDC090994 TaxID=3365969 RepID=UPI0037F7B7D1